MMEFYNESQHTARQSYKCEMCGGAIKVGEKYWRECGKFDGDFFSRKLHDICHWFEAEYCSEVDTEINSTGILEPPDCNCYTCSYFQAARSRAKTIKAVWGEPGEPEWTYETDIPHETFDIIQDGEAYCRGIVFDMKSLEDCKYEESKL